MAGGKVSLSNLAKGVDKNYRSDWPYLISASKMNSALSLATLFSAIAVVTRFSNLEELGTPALYCFLGATISYLMAIALIMRFAPAFLREFPNYSDFRAQENSHRWILWEFYYDIQKLTGGFKLLPETVSKKLSINVNSLGRSRLPIIKAFEKITVERLIDIGNENGGTEKYRIKLYEPVNFDRDILFGFSTASDSGVEKRYVLPVREKDEDLQAKCKELFWILFTESAKEHPKVRRFAWILVRLSGFLLLAAAGLAIYNVAFVEQTEELQSCCIHLVDLCAAIIGPTGLAQ